MHWLMKAAVCLTCFSSYKSESSVDETLAFAAAPRRRRLLRFTPAPPFWAACTGAQCTYHTCHHHVPGLPAVDGAATTRMSCFTGAHGRCMSCDGLPLVECCQGNRQAGSVPGRSLTPRLYSVARLHDACFSFMSGAFMQGRCEKGLNTDGCGSEHTLICRFTRSILVSTLLSVSLPLQSL